MLEVRFISSPTGSHKLAYNIGEIAKLPESLANKLIEDGVAEIVKRQKKSKTQTATSKKAENAAKR